MSYALLTYCPFDSPVCAIKPERHLGPTTQRMFCPMCFEYAQGKAKPNYPMPAIPLAVKYDYVGCVNIDDVTDEDDPIIVWMYDSWHKVNC